MCNCIQLVEDKVREEKGTDLVGMLHRGWSEVAYTPLTRAGFLSRRSRYVRVNWEFCPFCGEKLNVKPRTVGACGQVPIGRPQNGI